jgi:Gpi18-like mannosyltransferase
MSIKFNKEFFYIVLFSVVAILLKLYFLSQRGYEMDIATFLEWSRKITEGGFWSLYSSGYQSGLDYPPLVPLIGHYWIQLGDLLGINDMLNFKLLTTIAEIIFSALTAVFVYRSKSSYKIPLLAFVIIQPALGLITSAWGQVDSILSLFVIMAFLALEKNLYLSTFLLFIAFLTKPQAALAIMVYFFVVLFKKGFFNFIKQGVWFAVLVGFMMFLFNLKGSNFLSVYLMSTGRYPHPSMNAFNFWWVFFGEQAHSISDSLGTVISYKNLGFLLFGAFMLPAIYYLYKKAKDLSDYFLVASYFYIIFFVFPTQIHERYIFPALALLPFAMVKNKSFFWLYLVLSATLFLNNYAILQYAYPQFPVLSFLSPESWVGVWTEPIAIANVLIAIYLAIYFIYESYKKS